MPCAVIASQSEICLKILCELLLTCVVSLIITNSKNRYHAQILRFFTPTVWTYGPWLPLPCQISQRLV